MRIEILIDNQDPLIYPLDRPKIVIGSHESCDIVLKHKSISRKHIVIATKDDKFYVSDQGSTNGSFINEQQLVPGSSTEFTSFFPVRLGDDVLITLLSDEEAMDLGPESSLNTQAAPAAGEREESTKMISLADMKKTSTATLAKKRTETVAKRKSSVQKSKEPAKKSKPLSNTSMAIAGFILIGAVGYYQFDKKKKEKEAIAIAETQKVAPPPVAKVDVGPIKRVEETEIVPADKILANFKNQKCSQEIEKYLCVTLPNIFQGEWGTVLVDKDIIIVADGAKYAADARSYVKKPLSIEEGGTKVENDTYHLDLGLMMVVLWLNDNVPLQLEKFNGMETYKLTVAFVDPSKETPEVVSSATFVPESLLRLRRKITQKNFEDAKKNGALEFAYAQEYLRLL